MTNTNKKEVAKKFVGMSPYEIGLFLRSLHADTQPAADYGNAKMLMEKLMGDVLTKPKGSIYNPDGDEEISIACPSILAQKAISTLLLRYGEKMLEENEITEKEFPSIIAKDRSVTLVSPRASDFLCKTLERLHSQPIPPKSRITQTIPPKSRVTQDDTEELKTARTTLELGFMGVYYLLSHYKHANAQKGAQDKDSTSIER